MAKKPDRRSLRTKTALRGAFLQLLSRRGYDTISVQDIVDTANVGRSTFYAHCAGKDQLLRLSLDVMRSEMAEAQATARKRPDRPRFTFSLPILEHVAAHRGLYPHVMRGRGRAIFTTQMRDLVLQLVRNDLGTTAEKDELAAQFVTGAFISVLTWWVEHKTRLPPLEIDSQFHALAGKGVPPRGA